MLNPQAEAELIHAALQAQRNAYAPYSKFLVGAAILSPNGMVFRGCNVENASYGLTMCAERVAVGHMLVQGETHLQAIAIASHGGVTPCGACRQVLAEFSLDTLVILVDSQTQNVHSRWTLSELLPGTFRFNGSHIQNSNRADD